MRVAALLRERLQDMGKELEKQLEDLLQWLDQPIDLACWTPGASCAEDSPAKPAPVFGGPVQAEREAPLPAARALLRPAACERLGEGLSGSSSPVRVAVIAPGAGTGANGPVYARLERTGAVRLQLLGRAREPYDRYPESWPHGCPAPNLQSFAQDVLDGGALERSDCLVLGSRGGQVVLPLLWKLLGAAVPPAIVINGGCAMPLPAPVSWPEAAATFLLVGGRDWFRGDRTGEEYVAQTRCCVPAGNSTTAILYVEEMSHVPQEALLAAVLEHALQALPAWQAGDVTAPCQAFGRLLAALTFGGWNGRLMYTIGANTWQDTIFGPRVVNSVALHWSGAAKAAASGAHA